MCFAPKSKSHCDLRGSGGSGVKSGIYRISENSDSLTALVCGYVDFMQTSRKAVDKVLRISGFITCLPSLPPSTIHGRIDQVNQLLELDYQKRGGARYTALDKWTNQLNTLNQAIVSKLT